MNNERAFTSNMDDANFTHAHDIQWGNVTGDLNASYSLEKRKNLILIIY